MFAWQALQSNRLRTMLSLLGITIGIFAIISVFTVVDALEEKIQGSIEQLGDNVIYIQKWPWSFGDEYPWWKYYQRPLPGYSEMEALKNKTSNVAQHYAMMAYLSGVTLKFKSNSIDNADMTLVSHSWNNLEAFDLQSGRYFSEAESVTGRAVALIGSDVADNLFPNEDPIGKKFTAYNRKLIVIGVFSKEGSSMLGNSKDNAVVVPVNFARRFIDIRTDQLGPMIAVRAKDGVSNDQLKEEIRGALRSIRRQNPKQDDSFALNEASLLHQGVGAMFSFVTMAGWIIGGFSILVGTFGIANIMFVSVKERTPIIGIQKSLGAKNYFILSQFLFESIFLSLIGGLLGLLAVFIISLIASAALDFEMILSGSNILLGLTVSAITGIISGIVPALTASRLDPVEAIRSSY